MDDSEVDSFVVNNSEVEFESSLDELDMVDEFESDDDGKRKTRWNMTKQNLKRPLLNSAATFFFTKFENINE